MAPLSIAIYWACNSVLLLVLAYKIYYIGTYHEYWYIIWFLINSKWKNDSGFWLYIWVLIQTTVTLTVGPYVRATLEIRCSGGLLWVGDDGITQYLMNLNTHYKSSFPFPQSSSFRICWTGNIWGDKHTVYYTNEPLSNSDKCC